MANFRVIQGDCRLVLPTLPSNSVHCVVCSPPYWGLRSYGTETWEGGGADCDHVYAGATHGKTAIVGNTIRGVSVFYKDVCGKCGAKRVDHQIGLEPTLDDFITTMVQVFREVRRVLRPDGTLWLNLGDSYATQSNGRSAADTKAVGNDDRTFRDKPFSTIGGKYKDKDLMMQPARVAIALQEDGWWLRSDIIWEKVTPMPESVTDRPTSAHEHIFMLTKSRYYFYDQDAVRGPIARAGDWYEFGNKDPQARLVSNLTGNMAPGVRPLNKATGKGQHYRNSAHYLNHTGPVDNSNHTGPIGEANGYNPLGRNLWNIWRLKPENYGDAHFATYPPSLPDRCIRLGTSEKGCCPQCGAQWKRIVEKSGGTTGHSWHNHVDDEVVGQRKSAATGDGTYQRKHVGWEAGCRCMIGMDELIPATILDPFAGAFTTLMVAERLGRRSIGIELNEDYIKLGTKRVMGDERSMNMQFDFEELEIGGTVSLEGGVSNGVD